MEANQKKSKLGLISLIGTLITFILVDITARNLSSNNEFLLYVYFFMVVTFFITSIVGLTNKKQNRNNNIFSVLTILSVIMIFTLGALAIL